MISQLASFKVKYYVLRLVSILHGINHKVQITTYMGEIQKISIANIYTHTYRILIQFPIEAPLFYHNFKWFSIDGKGKTLTTKFKENQ